MNIEDRVEVLRHLERLLKQATILRIARDKEEKANRRRKHPDWKHADALSEKMKELNEYLEPSTGNGSYPTGLCPKYCDDSSFECYVLVSD